MGAVVGLVLVLGFLGLLAAGGVVWVVDLVNGSASPPDWLFLAAWVTSAVVIGAVILVTSNIGEKKKRVRWGRQFTLTGQIRELVTAQKADGPLSGDICFIGLTETSEYGPVYMVKASKPHNIESLAYRDDKNRLCFNGIPARREERFTHPSIPIHYVPAEVADDVVAMLNSALSAPFGPKELPEASRMVTGAVPWQAHGRLSVGGVGTGDPDPFLTRG